MTSATPVAGGIASPDAHPQAGDISFRPALMGEVELTRPLGALRGHEGTTAASLLIRLHTEPIGWLNLALHNGKCASSTLAGAIWEALHESVTSRYVAAGMTAPPVMTAAGLALDTSGWPYLEKRTRVLASAPLISVVVSTRDRPDRLRTCLSRLARQIYPAFETVVVDNAPRSTDVRRIADAQATEQNLKYVLEERPGLSWARNAGIAAADGEIVAFLDDDEAADEHWLAEIARGFARARDVGAVTGLILPGSLETAAQWWFEMLGGHSKGRGFDTQLISGEGPQSPLFPMPAFGAGGNMAFRRQILREIRGFDVALGAGTPAAGGEDTLALTLVLLAGARIAYQPSAFVRHEHYPDMAGLVQQTRSYGIGLTAYYSALLFRQPRLIAKLAREFPAAARYLRGQHHLGTPELKGIAQHLSQVKRRGMLLGPTHYVRSRHAQRGLRNAG